MGHLTAWVGFERFGKINILIKNKRWEHETELIHTYTFDVWHRIRRVRRRTPEVAPKERWRATAVKVASGTLKQRFTLLARFPNWYFILSGNSAPTERHKWTILARNRRERRYPCKWRVLRAPDLALYPELIARLWICGWRVNRTGEREPSGGRPRACDVSSDIALHNYNILAIDLSLSSQTRRHLQDLRCFHWSEPQRRWKIMG